MSDILKGKLSDLTYTKQESKPVIEEVNLTKDDVKKWTKQFISEHKELIEMLKTTII